MKEEGGKEGKMRQLRLLQMTDATGGKWRSFVRRWSKNSRRRVRRWRWQTQRLRSTFFDAPKRQAAEGTRNGKGREGERKRSRTSFQFSELLLMKPVGAVRR
jgi:hypothetical protein